MHDTSKILFLHVRKTAGTSARVALKNIFDLKIECPIRSQMELQAKISPEERSTYLKQFDFIAGHFDRVGPLMGDEFKLVIFLRNPFDRVVSAYNHIQNDTRDPLHRHAKGKSLYECLETPELSKEMKNSQTQYLVGNAGHDYEALNDMERLKIACAMLEKIDFLGITEELSLSLTLFAIVAGRPLEENVPELNREITKSGIAKEDAFAYLSAIMECNHLDLQLYNFARALFDKRTTKILHTIYKTGENTPKLEPTAVRNISPVDFDNADGEVEQNFKSSGAQDLVSLSLNTMACNYFPNVARFQFRTARALKKMREPEQAIIYLQKANELNPDQKQFHDVLISSLSALDQHQEIIELLLPNIGAQNLVAQTEYLTLCGKAKSPNQFFRAVLPDCDVSFAEFELSSPTSFLIRLPAKDAPLQLIFPSSFNNRNLLWRRVIILQKLLSFLREKNPGLEPLEFQIDISDGLQRSTGSICFSTSASGNLLIPDPTFLLTNGYADLKKKIVKSWIPFNERLGQGYWRGAVTGIPSENSLKGNMALPRIEFCKSGVDDDLFDAGITSLGNQQGNQPLEQALKAANIMAKPDPVERNLEYRYLIDIDGNTSSWPGLMSKLICGGVVIKLRGDPPFEQWYYDRLIDGKNLFFADNINDVRKIIQILENDIDRAEAIGHAGRDLALSLTVDSCLDEAANKIIDFARPTKQ